MFTDGVGYGKVIYDFLFSSRPKKPLQMIREPINLDDSKQQFKPWRNAGYNRKNIN